MFPRVVVTDHVVDAAGRRRVLECLATLHLCGVLWEVRIYLRAEQGALSRQAQTLAPAVKDSAAIALRVFAALESAAVGASMWLMARESDEPHVAAMEAQQMAALQPLMDLVFEAETQFDYDARTLVSGVGGCDLVPLGRFWATSGLEAAVNLAADVGRAVRAVEVNPFAKFWPHASGVAADLGAGARRVELAGGVEVLVRPEQGGGLKMTLVAKGKRKRKKLQRERPKPELPADTDPRDVAILRAMESGLTGKAVAPATGNFGRASSASHVEKRRADMVRWGWVGGGANGPLLDEGRRWLSQIPNERR